MIGLSQMGRGDWDTAQPDVVTAQLLTLSLGGGWVRIAPYATAWTLALVPQNFLGGPDEEWFRLVHVDIEARAGRAVARLEAMQRAAAEVSKGGKRGRTAAWRLQVFG